MPEEDASVLRILLKPPVKNGVVPPVIEATADLCSLACLRTYLEGGTVMKDLTHSLTRWAAVGALPQTPLGRRLGT
jgi:hypothetical protein